MIQRVVAGLAVLFAFWAPVALGDVPRVTAIEDRWTGGLSITIDMPRRAAYRVALADAPARIVVDLALPGLELADDPSGQDGGAARAGNLVDGWSRLVVDLDRPFMLDRAAFATLGDNLVLNIDFDRASRADFVRAAARSATMPVPRLTPPPARKPGLRRVVLDPGHGGVDPGAIRQGVIEKEVALAFALELADALRATGRYDVRLTREEDRFLPLAARVAQARAADPDIFLSLHANTVTEGRATGAVVYVLSDVASDGESAARAKLENRADIVSGGDGAGTADDITVVLHDMERTGTQARSRLAAESLVTVLRERDQAIAGRPLRSADFRVLRAPDMPSILLEIGFLSNERDRARMVSRVWRREMAHSVRDALDTWYDADRELISLMRRTARDNLTR